MQILSTDGFGTVKTIERSIVFFKKLPTDLSDDVLAMYEVPRERYLLAFNERVDKSIINKDLFNRFLTHSPHEDRLKNEQGITPEDD